MKCQLALLSMYFVILTINNPLTWAASFTFRDTDINGTLTRASGYCKIIGGQQLGDRILDKDNEFCTRKCVENPDCTHFNAWECTLYNSLECLDIDTTTYEYCDFIPSRLTDGGANKQEITDSSDHIISAWECTLYKSVECLDIDTTTYEYCGFVPSRLTDGGANKQETTYSSDHIISVCK